MFTRTRGVKNLPSMHCDHVLQYKRQDKTRQTYTNYRACFWLFYFNIIMANKRRSIDRSVIQVALILFQISPICSVLNFWDQRPCRCMETCMLHRRVIYQPYIFELIRCRQLTFCCFLSEINILPLTRSSEIHILIYFDLKSRFLTCTLHEMKILLVVK